MIGKSTRLSPSFDSILYQCEKQAVNKEVTAATRHQVKIHESIQFPCDLFPVNISDLIVEFPLPLESLKLHTTEK